MKISEIRDILNAEVMCGDVDMVVNSACAADMMSDVLAFVKEQAVLITGLNNPQVIRTAEMMDMKCVVLVRNKRPDQMFLEFAESKGIAVLCSKHRMYIACGLLYQAGLAGGEYHV